MSNKYGNLDIESSKLSRRGAWRLSVVRRPVRAYRVARPPGIEVEAVRQSQAIGLSALRCDSAHAVAEEPRVVCLVLPVLEQSAHLAELVLVLWSARKVSHLLRVRVQVEQLFGLRKI